MGLEQVAVDVIGASPEGCPRCAAIEGKILAARAWARELVGRDDEINFTDQDWSKLEKAVKAECSAAVKDADARHSMMGEVCMEEAVGGVVVAAASGPIERLTALHWLYLSWHGISSRLKLKLKERVDWSFHHNEDFSVVRKKGVEYALGASRRIVIEMLHDSYMKGEPGKRAFDLLTEINGNRPASWRDLWQDAEDTEKALTEKVKRGVYRLRVERGARCATCARSK